MDLLARLNEAIDFRHPSDCAQAIADGANPNALCFCLQANGEVPALGRAWIEHMRRPQQADHALFQVLIKGGARVSERHARALFKEACAEGEIETVRCLFDHGFELHGDLAPAFTLQLPVLAYLVEAQHLDINQQLDRRGTPLHHAVKMQRADLVAYLLDHQANIEGSDYEGNTPLLTACEYQCHDLIGYLLERGANPRVANFNGNTVLHLVNDAHTTQLLIEHGADPNAINDCGFAPVDCDRPQTVAALQAWQLQLATPELPTHSSRRL